MIASTCNQCCHFKNNKCLANQFYISTPKCSYAPGFCRIFRSNKWANNKNITQDNLIQLSIQESKLTYDLVIVHNNDNYLDNIETSLHLYSSRQNFDNICKRIIIADTTRKNDRKKIIDLFKKYKCSKNLDILMADHEEEKSFQTVKRLSGIIKEKYFVVIPSSKILTNRSNEIMTTKIDNIDTRFIFWPFVNRIGKTIILPSQPVFGLYITSAYKTLMRPTEIPKTFNERLKEEESSTGIYLSCPLDVAINNG